MNPCDAPLVNPVYPGSSSGYVTRFQSFTQGPTLLSSNSDQVFHFAPGDISTTQVGIMTGEVASGGTISLDNTINLPGMTFLQANASAARCVAACLKITFAGTESTRGGRLHYGHTQASLLDVGETTTINDLAPQLQNYSRIPAETVELVWKPSEGDMLFRDPNVAQIAQLRDTLSAITVAAAVNTGRLVYDVTVVYEWQPKTQSGVSSAPFNTNVTTSTFNDVYDAILRTGFRFVRDSMHQMGGNLLSRLANNLGVMPNHQATLSRSF